ncbi:MAG: thioredoxin domain-containing protein [Chitinophagaceae bacterium]|nr:thioredoxin domain-containing protein [Chitinophagaceae bacterium]
MSKLRPPVGTADQSAGNITAAVTLVEFGDYECPHCRHAHPLIKRLLKNKSDSFHFVFRNFPLQEIHPNAHLSALAAEAAGKQGKFWEMHDLIYDNQERLNGHFLLDLAKELDLDLHLFGSDWKSTAISNKVENDFESGVRSGVNGTPTFFINGNPLMTYDGSYESLVDALVLEAEMNGR